MSNIGGKSEGNGQKPGRLPSLQTLVLKIVPKIIVTKIAAKVAAKPLIALACVGALGIVAIQRSVCVAGIAAGGHSRAVTGS